MLLAAQIGGACGAGGSPTCAAASWRRKALVPAPLPPRRRLAQLHHASPAGSTRGLRRRLGTVCSGLQPELPASSQQNTLSGSTLHRAAPRPAAVNLRNVAAGVAAGGGVGQRQEGVATESYDPVKEDSRKYRRTVFDFASWREHRSVSRYARHAKGIFNSRMVRGLSAPLLYVFSISFSVAAFHTAVEAGLAPDVLRDLPISSNSPFGLTSFALSLLLVFRTNASYARWLDARKTWGLVVNRSRDLSRQALAYFPREEKALLDLFHRWTLAYTRSLMCHVREDSDFEEELSKVLPPHEVAAVLAVNHKPNFCMQVLSEALTTAQPALTASLQASGRSPAMISAAFRGIDQNLTTLEDTTGTCERILRSPIPLSYTRHTSRFMMIWLTLLPFSLWDNCGWTAVPLCCIIAFLLLGIEEIGVSIEEPFSILPLEQICDTIEANVKELRAVHGSRGAAGSAVAQAPSARQIVQDALEAEAATAAGAADAAAVSAA